MKIFDNRYITANADDEEPLCIRCDNCLQPEIFCVKYCGSKYGWQGYERTIDLKYNTN